MTNYALRIGDRGRLVLPAALRRATGFREGEELIATVEDDGRVVLASRDRLMDELRAACARMGARNGVDDLRAWREASDADRTRRLEQPEIDPATVDRRGRELLDALGIA